MKGPEEAYTLREIKKLPEDDPLIEAWNDFLSALREANDDIPPFSAPLELLLWQAFKAGWESRIEVIAQVDISVADPEEP